MSRVGLQAHGWACAQDRRNALAGIDILRKICNHPDLLQRAKWEGAPDYGNPARSGKLTVAMKARDHAFVSCRLGCRAEGIDCVQPADLVGAA